MSSRIEVNIPEPNAPVSFLNLPPELHRRVLVSLFTERNILNAFQTLPLSSPVTRNDLSGLIASIEPSIELSDPTVNIWMTEVRDRLVGSIFNNPLFAQTADDWATSKEQLEQEMGKGESPEYNVAKYNYMFRLGNLRLLIREELGKLQDWAFSEG